MESERLRPKEIVKRFKISSSQFFKRAKAGDFTKSEDGTYDVQELLDAGLRERSESETESEETPLVETLKDQVDTLKGLLEVSQASERELRVLLHREQDHIARLLPVGRDHSRWQRLFGRWQPRTKSAE